MKSKIILFLMMLIALPMISLMGNNAYAQTVAGTASTTNCLNGGSVTTSSTGLGSNPQYQLLKSGVVVEPVAGNTTQFTNTNVFSGLADGSYTVKARADASGTVYTSTAITVDDGYIALAISTLSSTIPCTTATTPLTSTINSGGKAPFTYTIALQSSPGTIIQNSGSTAATTFTFNPLSIGNYIVSVTDACGNTVTGASSITQSGATISQVRTSALEVGRLTAGSCSAKIVIRSRGNFTYVSSPLTPLSTADKANFSWRLEFGGLSYGKDITGDGNPDLSGPNFDLFTIHTVLPLGITDLNLAVAGNPKIVIFDKCNNSRTFTPTISKIIVTPVVCGGTGIVQLWDNGGANTWSMACYPVTWTFTSPGNPTITHVQNSVKEIIPQNFIVGATYAITAIDAVGNMNSSISQNSTITFPSNANNFSVGTILRSAAFYNTGTFIIGSNYNQPGDVINVQITASSVPSMVGYNYNYTVPASVSGSLYFNAPNPPMGNSYPAGNYTLQISGLCGVRTQTFTIPGYTGVLSSLTTSQVCGGFDVVGNTTLVEDPAFYEIVIFSGPSNVGSVRDLASTAASLPFNGLAYGTYVFGIRVKGNTVVFNTQTVTYGAGNAITVDTSATGGYVCSAGANNGILTIVANSSAPAPGNVLTYALSLDGGATFGAYQSSNIFTGLTNGTYTFRVKDGCGNIITQTTQVGVAASPTASANGISTPVTFCNLGAGTIQLDVDIAGASSYLWTGPGITSANQNVKNPVVNYSNLVVGANNYTCTITLGAPCNSTSISNLVITINPLPNVIISNPASVCSPNTVDLTLPVITAGSTSGLTYTYFTDAAGTIALANPNAVATSGTYYIKGTNSNSCSTIKPVTVTITACSCTKTPATGTPNSYTKVGITVQQKQSAWPENIPNGFLALESKEKGLVITRIAHVSSVPSATDAVADPKAGMIVYDIQDSCVKLFNGTNWNCIKKSCNE